MGVTVVPSHFLFISIPDPGRLFPHLAVGKELVRRGHRVEFVTVEPMAGLVGSYGAEPLVYVAERQFPCCGKVNQGKAPAWAAGRISGVRVCRPRAVLATIGHHLPYARAARLLAQLAGLDVSVGFLIKARRRAADL